MKASKEASYGVIPIRKKNGVWQVLVIKHQSGDHWSFPKGHAIEGETPKEAAVRELKEETGLSVKRFLSEEPLEECYIFERGDRPINKKVTYFLGEINGEVYLQEEEISGGKWVPLYEADAHVTYEESKSICLRLMEIFQGMDY